MYKIGYKNEMIEKSRGLRREKLYKITLISTNKKKTPPMFDSNEIGKYNRVLKCFKRQTEQK